MSEVQQLIEDLYGTEDDEGDINRLLRRLDKLLELLVKKGVISTDEYEVLTE